MNKTEFNKINWFLYTVEKYEICKTLIIFFDKD